ncbi:hypothetical protein QLX67_12320 [Balneolaceae bacterium ANBcel3]|nr:hypothetical protein [Balneolaceae bacterium ANBcel3]
MPTIGDKSDGTTYTTFQSSLWDLCVNVFQLICIRRLVHKHDKGRNYGSISGDPDRIEKLERENREIRQANEMLRRTSG